MNGMELREMDRIIYPVCKLCREHERSGFVEGIKLGVLLQAELTEQQNSSTGLKKTGAASFWKDLLEVSSQN